MTTKGTILVVSAPSGGGKGTILGRIMAEDKLVVHSVSVTTRQPRGNEKDGTHYFFASPEQFNEWIADDKFYEWAEVHGNFYGTLKDEIDKHVKTGYDVVMELDIQGMRSVKAQHAEVNTLFIMPPSLNVLEERLRSRGDLDEAQLQMRLCNARDEMEARSEYDFVVVNDSLDEAISEVNNILNTLRQSRRKLEATRRKNE
jgi:guanylate kinase